MSLFMSKQTLPLFKLLPWIALATMAAPYAHSANVADRDPADTAAPYYAPPAKDEKATSFTLDAAEYKDLKAYLQVAHDTLERTLKEARKLGGKEEHENLVKGAEDAIKQSGLKFNLMLFRHVLERGLDTDAVYLSASGPLSPRQTKARIDAANQVLLMNIRKAKDYYNSSLPSISQNSITVPNWTAFALDFIPIYQIQIDLAPSMQAKTQLALRALGWTARSLNTSLEREQFAKEIQDLMEMQRRLRTGDVKLPAAQQLLLDISERLNQWAKHARASRAVPTSAYPSSITAAEGDAQSASIFPLIGGTSMLAQKMVAFENDDLIHFNGELGVGAIVEYETGQTTQYFAQLNARATLLASQSQSHFGRFLQGAEFADARGQVGINGYGKPVYRLKFTGDASIMAGVGIWVAVEANQYETVKEQIFRFGWGPMAAVRINDRDYVMIRGGLGTSINRTQVDKNLTTVTGSGAGQTVQNESSQVAGLSIGTLSAELQAMLKIGSFTVAIEGNIDNLNNADRLTRQSVSLDVTIPLGVIFGNDAIQVQGSLTHIAFRDLSIQDKFIPQATLSYLVKW